MCVCMCSVCVVCVCVCVCMHMCCVCVHVCSHVLCVCVCVCVWCGVCVLTHAVEYYYPYPYIHRPGSLLITRFVISDDVYVLSHD